MKKYTLPLMLLFLWSGHAQLTAERPSNAWRRTSHEIWSNFRPWFYYNILHRSYKREDRRTIYSRTGAMVLWSSYADQYEMHERTVDSILNQEIYKALDRSTNKNYLLLQRSRVNQITDLLARELETQGTSPLAQTIYGAIQNHFAELINDIDFVLNAYAPDTEKYPLIEAKIHELGELFVQTRTFKVFEPLLEDIEDQLPLIFDFNTITGQTLENINRLIIEQ